MPTNDGSYLNEYHHGLVQGAVGTLIACVVASLIYFIFSLPGEPVPPQPSRNYYTVVVPVERIREMIDLEQLKGYTPPTKETENDRRIHPRRIGR